jgi:hypothetical protein
LSKDLCLDLSTKTGRLNCRKKFDTASSIRYSKVYNLYSKEDAFLQPNNLIIYIYIYFFFIVQNRDIFYMMLCILPKGGKQLMARMEGILCTFAESEDV